MAGTATIAKPAPLSLPPEVWRFQDAVTIDQGLLVPALLFTEGDFVDGNGEEGSFNASDLDRIVAATIAYHGAGGDVPIFESNHDLITPYQNSDKIGRLAVDAGLTVETITAENLPDPRLTELIGRKGIFGFGYLVRADAVERYQQKLIKPLSIAFDPSGEWSDGYKWAIFEVSAVPWGAVKGAMFFCKEQPVKMALTLDGKLAEAQNIEYDDEFHRLMMLFGDVVDSINATSETELMGRSRERLLAQAIDDLGTRLRDHFGITPQPLPPVPPPQMSKALPKETDMATENTTPETQEPAVNVADLTARIEALEAKNQQLQEQAEKSKQETEELKELGVLSDRIAAMKAQGQKLVSQGKMTPAKFSQLFPQEGLRDSAMRFAKPMEGNKFSGESGLIRLEATLEAAAESDPVVQFGAIAVHPEIGNSPYADSGELTESQLQQAQAVAKSVTAKRPY